MDSENSSVFTLITRLCEKILDEPLKYNDRSSRFAGVKKLRTRAYSMLLNPADHDLPPSSHDCFVKVIATAFDNGILHDNVHSEEFNKCVDHLLLESNKITYIPSVIYFLANMYNERQTIDVLFKDTGADENENFNSIGFSASILPKKYHLYHPSSFILPDLHSSMSNNAKINYLTYSQKIQNNSVVRPICNFQCNFKITKFPEKTFKNSSAPFPSLTRDQHEITWNHLEDEGYVSPGATPLGTTPGELSAPPWYELDLDFNSNQKARHLTWELLGEPVQAKEKPPLFEAGVEALHCNLKIRENLLLTFDPRISIQLRDPIHWKSLLHHVTFLIMGLESESFIFNEQFDGFELVEGIWLEGISYETLSACLADFIVMGTCFRRLLSFVESPSSDGYIEGIVQQVIRKSTGRYLHLYRGACLLVMHDLLQRKSFSILLMRLRLKGLQQQILCLASAYGKWGSGAPIPSGVEALGHLHRHASGAQRKDVASLFRYILHAGCIVYFNILERWVYDGEIVDGGDFFVVQRLEYLSCRNRRYWTRAFQFNAAAVPEFLCGLKPFLLRCGKSVHFLKICDPKHPSLQEGQSLLASLKQTHSLTISSEVQIESTESVEESKVSLKNVESFPSEPSEESKPLKEPPHPSISEVDSKINEEYEEETDSLEILEEKTSKLRGEVKELLNDDLEEEKIIEEEKKKLIEYYKKLGEASDKRRVRAEWRVHRMGLRTGDFMPCTRDGVSGGDSLQTVHTERPDHNWNNVTSEEKSAVREAFEEESQETQASEHQGEDDVTVKSEVEIEIAKVEENERGMEDVEEESCDDVKLVVDLSEVCSERTEETIDLKKETSDIEEEMCQGKIQDLTPSNLSYFKSPNRTPLKKLSGLFPFNPHLHGSKRESKENNQDEVLPAEWPYRSVLYSLMMYSNKMDAALLHWMLVEKGLMSHLRSLRAYFFLLDGEFGRRLSEDLFSAMRRAPGGKPSIEYLNVLSLSRILSHALASSTFAASDPNATLFSLNLSQCPEQTPGVDPLSCVHMLYKAPWPLNVILTEEAVSKYSRVLDLLLRLKHASWALEQTFLHLRVLEPGKGIAKVFPRRWRSPHEAVQNSPQYHQLQLYRHQMMHLVCAVQSYITSGVLQASGKKLDEAIANSSCLDEFYAEHVLYVKKILFGCLLNKRSETIANILNDILRLIMKFHWSLCSRSWYIPPDQETSKSCHYEHPNFKVLCKIYGAFEDMTDFLLKYAWRLASHGYQADLFELLQMINVNNFY